MDKSREAMLAQMGDHLQKPKVSAGHHNIPHRSFQVTFHGIHV